MIKKILSVLLSALMLMSLFAVSAAAAQTPVLELVAGEIEDSSVNVELYIRNNPGITALQVQVAYSTADLELIDVVNGGLFDSALSKGSIENNPVNVTWYATDSENKEESGLFATLIFNVKEGAKNSNVTLTYDADNIFNNTFNNIKFDVKNTTVSVDKATQPTTEDPSTDPSATEPSSTTASLNKTSAKLKAGKTASLKVTGGTVKSWSSSKKKVATVKNGKVTALKKGTSNITATLTNGKKLVCKVTVSSSPTLKIGKKKFKAKTTYSVKKGKSLTVSVTGKASTVKNTYKSSKKKIAKVTSKATAKKVKIKGLKKGKAKITIKVNGVSFKIKVKVK